jgi:prepilin-type N-terminal cleavage/methylation domain-containing protein
MGARSAVLTVRRSACIRRGRGVTLLELLVALALVLAMLAIAAPVLVDRLGDRAFEHAADAIERQLLLARAHAQSTGRAVEVVHDPSQQTVVAREFDPDEDERPPLPWSWSTLSVPEGVSLRASREAATEEAGDEAPALTALRLAIFLPDGSAITSRAIWIVGENDRAAQLSINLWTGLPALDAAGFGGAAADVDAAEAEEP